AGSLGRGRMADLFALCRARGGRSVFGGTGGRHWTSRVSLRPLRRIAAEHSARYGWSDRARQEFAASSDGDLSSRAMAEKSGCHRRAQFADDDSLESHACGREALALALSVSPLEVVCD